jgi:hypothetical protein
MSEIISVNSAAPVAGNSIGTNKPSSGSTSPGGQSFSDFLSGVVSGANNLVSDGLSVAGSGLGSSTDLFGLIELQRQIQFEMETVSMISNIEKSRHESRMSAIRNVRAS